MKGLRVRVVFGESIFVMFKFEKSLKRELLKGSKVHLYQIEVKDLIHLHEAKQQHHNDPKRLSIFFLSLIK